MVVLDDADLDEAAAAANFGAFMHQGQICMSTERIVVDRSVAERPRRAARRARVGAHRRRPARARDPDRADGQRRPRRERVSELVEDARATAPRCSRGGEADGLRYSPDRAGRRHAGDAAVRRGVVRPGRHDRAGRRRRRGGAGGQRHRVRARRRAVFGRDVAARLRRRAPDRDAASATSTARPSTTSRRCRSAASRPVGLRPLRRPRRARGVHRAALDHGRQAGGAPLPDLGRYFVRARRLWQAGPVRKWARRRLCGPRLRRPGRCAPGPRKARRPGRFDADTRDDVMLSL